MCRMMAVAGTFPTEAEVWDSFRQLAETGVVATGRPSGHRHGWGFSYQTANLTGLTREMESAAESDEFQRAVESVPGGSGTLALAHLRKASESQTQDLLGKVHPFVASARGTTLFFAHNGSINDWSNFDTTGKIDSEHFLDRIIEEDLKTGRMDLALENTIGHIQEHCDYSSLTFLLTDGENLYAYRNARREDQYYTLYSLSMDGTHFICSEPLSVLEGDWLPFENNQLMIIDGQGNVQIRKTL